MNNYRWLTTRVSAILCHGRGVDGALGTEARARAIEVGRFRPALANCPLSDPTYPPEAFDRALRLSWVQADDFEGVNNSLDVRQLRTARMFVHEGLVCGQPLVEFVMPVGSEDRTDAVLYPEERGMGDADRMMDALHQTELWRDGTETDPVPIACVREGGTSIEKLGGGRMIALSVYRVTFETTNTNPHDP